MGGALGSCMAKCGVLARIIAFSCVPRSKFSAALLDTATGRTTRTKLVGEGVLISTTGPTWMGGWSSRRSKSADERRAYALRAELYYRGNRTVAFLKQPNPFAFSLSWKLRLNTNSLPALVAVLAAGERSADSAGSRGASDSQRSRQSFYSNSYLRHVSSPATVEA